PAILDKEKHPILTVFLGGRNLRKPLETGGHAKQERSKSQAAIGIAVDRCDAGLKCVDAGTVIVAGQPLIPSHLPGAAPFDGMIAGDLGPVVHPIKQSLALNERTVAAIAQIQTGSSVCARR